MISDYEHLATGRTSSLFEADIEANRASLAHAVGGSRVAVIGAAGSIGFSVVKGILEFSPAGLTLIDISENNLVEVVRDLRSTQGIDVPEDFLALPVAMGSSECTRFICETAPFDYILNLSAIKHVRTEKDMYCVARMLDTNVLSLADLLEDLPYELTKFFSVSSDKATNPASLMGASKMVMEELLRAQSHPFSTARFANVSFSDGSLPYGFLRRIDKRQPISSPRDVRRYFMSHEEAGQICILSAFQGENADVYFPRLAEGANEKTFSDIAVQLLEHLGFDPVLCDSENEAKRRVGELIPQKQWPCFFFDTDTSGEKLFEEFYRDDESVDFSRYENIGVIKRAGCSDDDRRVVREFLEFAKAAKQDANVTKADYVREVCKVVPGFGHIETGKNLDQKM